MTQVSVDAVHRIVEAARDEIVEFAQHLIRTPSITGDEHACAQVVRDKMLSLGLETHWVEPKSGRPNVVGYFRGQRPGKQFIYNGHIDTVPPGPRDEWRFDPFSAQIEDGKLYGRGACDMKAGLACMIMATGLFSRLGVPLAGSAIATAVCDEQFGSVLGTQYLVEQGYIQGDMGIVGESTNMRIDIGHKGIHWAEIIARGKAIHASRPWLGVNAIEHMHAVMHEVLQVSERLAQRERDPWLGHPTAQVTMFQGGTAENMIPSYCRMVVDRRLVYGETDETARKEIEDCLETVRARVPDILVHANSIKYKPTVFVDPDSPIVKITRQCIEDVTGSVPVVAGKDGGTDATWIVNMGKVPAIIFGPGEYLKASLAADEFVSIEDMISATKVYMLAALRAWTHP